MENSNVVFPSPTPPQKIEIGEIQQLSKLINSVCGLYRFSITKFQITAFAEHSDVPIVINLSELPDELREGLHNYATRLIADKHLLKAKSIIQNS